MTQTTSLLNTQRHKLTLKMHKLYYRMDLTVKYAITHIVEHTTLS